MEHIMYPDNHSISSCSPILRLIQIGPVLLLVDDGDGQLAYKSVNTFKDGSEVPQESTHNTRLTISLY